jgi:hypothetical protein
MTYSSSVASGSRETGLGAGPPDGALTSANALVAMTMTMQARISEA